MFRKTCVVSLFLLITCFCVTLMGDETANKYFPTTIGSYWVYEDQDGNELTRRAVEGEEIAGEMYQAFEYEPAFENWENYEYHIHPTLFMVDDSGIKFHIGDTVKKTYKERLTKELEHLFTESRQNMPPEAQIKPKIDVEIDNQDTFYLLPFPITLNEEWDTMRIKPTFKMMVNMGSEENNPELTGASYTTNIYFTIMESGNLLTKETVETPAGKFDDCLKIEYRTETVTPKIMGEETLKAGESVTNVWLAPDVGIVKFYQESEKPILDDIGNIKSTTQVKTYELKKYEIKTATTEGE